MAKDVRWVVVLDRHGRHPLAGGLLTCALGSIAPQGEVTLSVKIGADSTRATIENTAQLTSPTGTQAAESSGRVANVATRARRRRGQAS